MPKPFPDHFSAVARAYADRRPRYPDALFDHLALLPARRDLAWDCGAGSGQATLSLARHFRRVVATDASAAQLAAATSHPQVEYRAAPAEASGLEANTTDLVTVAQALHWFNVAAFYAEARRVLAPGGVVAVWAYGRSELDDERLDRVLRAFYDDVVGHYWPAERRHVENGYRDLAFPFAELPAPAFTMEARWTLPELLGYVGTWSAVVRFRTAEGRDPLGRLGRELETVWGGAGAVRRVRWPLHLRIGCEPGHGLRSR
jgi:ubiquinone/menaquinone biosynthesis C-methylase UbiE